MPRSEFRREVLASLGEASQGRNIRCAFGSKEPAKKLSLPELEKY